MLSWITHYAFSRGWETCGDLWWLKGFIRLLTGMTRPKIRGWLIKVTGQVGTSITYIRVGIRRQINLNSIPFTKGWHLIKLLYEGTFTFKNDDRLYFDEVQELSRKSMGRGIHIRYLIKSPSLIGTKKALIWEIYLGPLRGELLLWNKNGI